jgi:hypothetical protein
MSPRLFTTPRDDGRTGGDRPLRSLCLVITDRHTGEIGDSHLDDPHGPGLSRPSIRQRHDVVDVGVLPADADGAHVRFRSARVRDPGRSRSSGRARQCECDWRRAACCRPRSAPWDRAPDSRARVPVGGHPPRRNAADSCPPRGCPARTAQRCPGAWCGGRPRGDAKGGCVARHASRRLADPVACVSGQLALGR